MDEIYIYSVIILYKKKMQTVQCNMKIYCTGIDSVRLGVQYVNLLHGK